MQAALLLVLFTLLFTLMNGIIGNKDSSAQLRAQRIEETAAYFKSINLVVNNDITPNLWRANPNGHTNVAQYINQIETLKQLSPSRFDDKALDPWGSAITGAIVTQSMPIFFDGTARIFAPVTGFLLVSPGPDKVLQTTIPTLTTLTALQGVVAQGDDIVYTFTDEQAQRDQVKRLQGHVGRIAAAALQKYQVDIAAYRAARVAAYESKLASSGNIANLSDMMEDGTDAPTFTDISKAANRVNLGVDENFLEIEQGNSITGGTGKRGTLRITNISNPASKTLTVQVHNGSPASPWTGGAGGLLYQTTIKGN